MMRSSRWRFVSITTAGLVLLTLAPPAPSQAAVATVVPSGVTQRVFGADRYATAVAISHLLPVGPHYAMLATGEKFPDALAASSNSLDPNTARNAPILLTPSAAVPTNVMNELAFHLTPADKVFLMGGPLALSPSIDTQLSRAGYTPVRLQSTQVPGSQPVDRYDTAAAFADMVFGPSTILTKIILATGDNFPDALSVSAYAAANTIPILLVTAGGIPKATQDFLDTHSNGSTTVEVVGGPLAAAAPTAPAGIAVKRVAGANRYDTAAQVAGSADFFGLSATTSQRHDDLVLARGDDFADALAGGPLAAAAAAPLYLTLPSTLPTETAAFVNSLGYDRPLRQPRSFVLGGTKAISDPTVASWANVLNGFGFFGAQSSTFRDDLASVQPGFSPPSPTFPPPGDMSCTPTSFTQALDFTATGDVPGALSLATLTFCPNAAMTIAPSETTTVLPGSKVTFTPKGGAALNGHVTGGFQGAPSQDPTQARMTAIDFVLDIGVVGHVSFSDPGSTPSGASDAIMALVAGTLRPFTAHFSMLPAGCGSVSSTLGAIGSASVTMSGITACRASSASTIWRLSGGTIAGALSGQVVSGIVSGTDLGLALRTDSGLIDVTATLDSPTAPAPFASGSAVAQQFPENSGTVAFSQSAAPGGAGSMTAGCPGASTGGSSGRKLIGPNTGGTTTFPGTLDLQANFTECTTDAKLGVVEPNDDTSSGTTGCDARSVVYYTTDAGTTCTTAAGEVFRGRVLDGTYTADAMGHPIIFYLTLLLQENNFHLVTAASPSCPMPNCAVDDAPNSVTVVRVVVPAGGGAGLMTFAR